MSVTNIANLGIRVQYQDADKAKAAIDRLAASAPKASSAVDKLRESFDKMGTAGKTAAGIVAGFSIAGAIEGIASAAGGMVSQMIAVAKATQTTKASLETLTGSAGNAQKAFEQIEKFATQTPFSLQQVNDAFIKLKALGLDPSEEALRSYGNTASAMGKDLMQFIEAVADASTGEFERLKEFGIKSKKEGDNVKFTFQGVTTTVKNNSEEIQKYLRAIGDVQFAGAMDRQMKTIGGAISNMGDAWDRFLRKLGETGIIEGITLAIRGVTKVLEILSDNINTVAGVLAGAFAAGLGLVTRMIVGAMIPALTAMAVAIGRLTMAMLRNPMTLIWTAISVAIGFAVEALLEYKDKVSEVAGRTAAVGEVIAEVWTRSGNLMHLILSEFTNELSTTFTLWGQMVTSLWDGIAKAFTEGDFSFSAFQETLKKSVDSMNWDIIMDEATKLFDIKVTAANITKNDPPARDTSGGKGDGDTGEDKDKKKEKVSEYDRETQKLRENIAEMRIRIDNILATEAATEKLVLMDVLKNAALQDGKKWTDALRDSSQKLVDEYVNLSTEYDRLKNLLAEGKSVTEDMLTVDEKRTKVIAELDEMLKRQMITQETYNRKIKDLKEEALEESKVFGDGIQRAMSRLKTESEDMAGMAEDMVLTTFNNMADGVWDFTTRARSSFSDFAKQIIDDIGRIATRMAVLQLFNMGVNAISGAMGGTGGEAAGAAAASGPPVDLGAGSGIYAKGGIHGPNGPVRLYANGGIASSPQVAIFGEGAQNEAFVPLPDNRSIPVTLTGNNGGSTQIINQINTTINASGGMSDQDSKDMAAQFNTAVEVKWDQKMSAYQRSSANRRLQG
jgi:lambda family phage tail tape measure protein